MKVLVVDDQPDVAAGILDGVDWRALHVEKAYSALSAAEAKALLLREKIDILLCDIEMPGENGLSLVAWLRKQGQQTKCIFLTAHADFPYAQKALQLGAVDYLLQPASYQSIETAIRGAAEQLQEERLSQVYEALGKSVERETLDFRRNVLREYLLGIRRGPQKVAEKAAAFGFLASSRAYRCALIAIQEPAKNQTDDFLLYGIQNVLEELLQACAEQVTVLFLEQKMYLAILALADNPPEGAEQSIEQGLETLCRFGSRELHMGLSCYCSKECVRFEELPQEYQQLRRRHRHNVACSCGLILPKKQGSSSLKPEFPKWAGMLSQGLGADYRYRGAADGVRKTVAAVHHGAETAAAAEQLYLKKPCAVAGGPGGGGKYEAQCSVGQQKAHSQQPQVQADIAEVQLQGPEGAAQSGGEGQEHPGTGRPPALPGIGYKEHYSAEDRFPQGRGQKAEAGHKDQNRVGGAQQRRHKIPAPPERQGAEPGGTQAQKVVRQQV